MFPSRKKTRGIGLLELILAILVMAALAFSAAQYYRVTRDHMRVTQAENMVRAVADASYKWVGGQYSFAKPKSISMERLADAGLVPKTYQNMDSNPWQGKITVSSAESGKKVTIGLSRLPIRSCRDLLGRLLKYACDGKCMLSQNGIEYTGTFTKDDCESERGR